MNGRANSAGRRVTPGERRSSWAAVVLCGWMLLLFTSHGRAENKPRDNESREGYIGSQGCSRCHLEIYQRYSQTDMGRSMSLVSPTFLHNTPLPASHLNERLNRKFEVYAKDDKLYQSESGVAADGKETFRSEHPMEWVIGTGMNGFGVILQRDQYLFQAPLSFYSRTNTWGPSPGYALTDLGFNRPILPGCIFCHSGRPNSIAGGSGQFESKPFSVLAIGCESCHGPGAAHVSAMENGGAKGTSAQDKSQESLDTRIVNPSRLTHYLSDNICMACHQTGDVRVLKPGKTYQDVRPGAPLDDTLSILIVPPTRESPPSSDHVEHYYSMTLSKCYRASQGRMSCTTCHDPHEEPSREEAPAYFAAKCMTCHTNRSCKLPVETRMHSKPPNDCISCHMPRRDIEVISHSSATNHRIVARPDEPFPDVTFKQTRPSLPDLIHLNPARTPVPGQEAPPLPLLTLLQAYGELAENKPEYVGSYLKVLAQLEREQPNDPLVQAALGRKDLKSGDYQSAVVHLRRALAIRSNVETTYADLADALTHLGETEEALPLLERAIELNAFNPTTRKMLVVILIQTKQYAKAREALEQYMDRFPQDDFMRQMLERAEGKSQ
jgi:hypothetical protein